LPDRPLRILHLTLGADAGGLSRYIIDVGNALIERGHEVIAAGDTGAWQWAFDQSRVKYIQIPLKGGLFSFHACVKTLRKFVRDNPVDVIHTHYRRATLLGRRIQRHAAAGHTAPPDRAPRKRAPVLYTVHLSHISLKFPRNLLSDFGDVAHVAAPEARDWLINDAHLAPERTAFIPHGIPVRNFPLRNDAGMLAARASLQLHDDDVVAIYVGRLDWPKNEEWMIDLADAARFKVPRLRVLLVGEGPHEAMLRSEITRRSLADRVFVLGHRDPLPCYQAADLLCLPSQREGFSLVCGEAMSVGVPILRTRTSGTRQLVHEKETGRSVEINRDAFIATAIEMLSDRANLRRMGQQASQLIHEQFTFERQVEETIKLYAKLAS
jgi:glycosyltransferase involved in cell wall biosynthesis